MEEGKNQGATGFEQIQNSSRLKCRLGAEKELCMDPCLKSLKSWNVVLKRHGLKLEPATILLLCPIGSQCSTFTQQGLCGKCVLVRHTPTHASVYHRECVNVCVSLLMSCVSECMCLYVYVRHQMAPNPEALICFSQQLHVSHLHLFLHRLELYLQLQLSRPIASQPHGWTICWRVLDRHIHEKLWS